MPNLPTESSHTISYTTHGNLSGPAIISFHGGPGDQSKPSHAERFDLNKYQVILFDQRGCGQSTPLGETKHNTTQDLIQDAERIRETLNIEKWFVSGSSWGSTLALLYAQTFPHRVQGLLLSAIFLANQTTLDWSFHTDTGAAQLVPDVLEQRNQFLKKFNLTPHTAAQKLSQLIQTENLETQQEITAGVLNWENNLFSPLNQIKYLKPEDISEQDIASTKIFLHYEANNSFLEDDQIIKNISTIKHIPSVIVHGRYDILCPLSQAYRLSQVLDNTELVIAGSSGHAFSIEGEEIRRLAYDHFLFQNS